MHFWMDFAFIHFVPATVNVYVCQALQSTHTHTRTNGDPLSNNINDVGPKMHSNALTNSLTKFHSTESTTKRRRKKIVMEKANKFVFSAHCALHSTKYTHCYGLQCSFGQAIWQNEK